VARGWAALPPPRRRRVDAFTPDAFTPDAFTPDAFTPVVLAIVNLVTSRDELRNRLRRTTPVGIPGLAGPTVMFVRYLTAKRDLGRIATEADLDRLALILVGTNQLLLRDGWVRSWTVGRWMGCVCTTSSAG
jgi:hypothetical protein